VRGCVRVRVRVCACVRVRALRAGQGHGEVRALRAESLHAYCNVTDEQVSTQ
jgi:hypothetical protein